MVFFSYAFLSSWTPFPINPDTFFLFKNSFKCYHLFEKFHHFPEQNYLSLPPTFESSSLNISVIWCWFVLSCFACLSHWNVNSSEAEITSYMYFYLPYFGSIWHHARNNCIAITMLQILTLYQTQWFLCHAWRNWSRKQFSHLFS